MILIHMESCTVDADDDDDAETVAYLRELMARWAQVDRDLKRTVTGNDSFDGRAGDNTTA